MGLLRKHTLLGALYKWVPNIIRWTTADWVMIVYLASRLYATGSQAGVLTPLIYTRSI